MNDKAQVHTLESLAAALFITMAVYIVSQSVMVVTPQPEMLMDVQLKQTASDTLTVLDIAPESVIEQNLTESVAGWDLNQSSLEGSSLDHNISRLLPEATLHNVDLAYVENGDLEVEHVIVNGAAGDSSVVARRLVTLYNSTVTDAGGAWNLSDNELKVVEVRLIAWQV